MKMKNLSKIAPKAWLEHVMEAFMDPKMTELLKIVVPADWEIGTHKYFLSLKEGIEKSNECYKDF